MIKTLAFYKKKLPKRLYSNVVGRNLNKMKPATLQDYEVNKTNFVVYEVPSLIKI
jgi:hypothetical protein